MPTINLPVKGEADWDVKLNAAINTVNAAVTAQGDSLPEAIQDGIASTLVAGTNVTLVYDDTAGTLTISSTGGGGGGVTLPIAMSDVTGLITALAGKQPTGSYATTTQLTDGLATKQATGDYATNTALSSGLAGKAATTHTHTASQVTDFTEAAQDATAALLVAGANITVVYDDAANTLTISGTGGGGVTLPIAQSDVTGLVSALSGKQATGDYATNSALTSGLNGKANSSHTHVISDVSSLQAALDGKQAAGSYATATALSSGLAGKADTAHTHTASQITDSTAVGRSVLTAADAAAARSAIGAGTSSLSLGTTSTTAKAGDYQPTADQITETTNNKVMTAVERTKLSGIAAGATAVIIAATLGDASVTGAPIGSVIVVQ